MSKLISIDPATKSLGYAIFVEEKLTRTGTLLSAHKNRTDRTQEITGDILDILEKAGEAPKGSRYEPVSEAVIEDTLFRGKANTTFQRFLGALELSLITFADSDITTNSIYYIHNQTLKRVMAGGKQGKLLVAEGAMSWLKIKAEKAIMRDAMRRQAWDETDAVALGITYLKGLYL